MLELRGASKSFEGTVALLPTDLSVAPGETTALIGPSGCGKSTLLRLMIGLLEPDAGTVSFDGAALSESNLLAARHRMGYVIQDGGLFPHLTARGNVALLARFLGRATGEIDARLAELAALTQFPPDGLDRFPTELSGGQRQRVALMRALMLDPEVLLLDEPLGALDPMIRAELQQDLRRIFRDLGKTVVLVTHDLSEAEYFGDEIVLLKDGAIVQRGTIADFRSDPADEFVSRFLDAQQRRGS